MNKLQASRDNVSSIFSAVQKSAELFNPLTINQTLANAYKIALCNDQENQWKGCDVVNRETGECFEAAGRFYRCNQRLCHDCLSNFQRRNRKKIRNLMKEHKQFVGYHYRLFTFTIVNHNLPLQESRELLERTWQLFRKRVYFKRNFKAGVKAEEFEFTTNGFHYHLHMIADTRYIMYAKLRSEWTTCYLKAAEEFGLDQIISNVDGLLSVKCDKIYENTRSVFEVTKYITKSATWSKVNPEDLIEYATIKRHPRMTEFFGEWRSKNPLPDAENEIERFPEDAEDKTIVHKENLSDGTNVKIMPLEHILATIHQKSVDAAVFRMKQIRYRDPQAILSYKKSDGYAKRIAELCLKNAPSRFAQDGLDVLNALSIPNVTFSIYKP